MMVFTTLVCCQGGILRNSRCARHQDSHCPCETVGHELSMREYENLEVQRGNCARCTDDVGRTWYARDVLPRRRDVPREKLYLLYVTRYYNIVLYTYT